MDFNATSPSFLVTALALVQEHGDAEAALRATGLDLDHLERFDGVPDDILAAVEGKPPAEALRQMLALGFLAGRVANRPRPRRGHDPSSFFMDPELLVRGAEGESVLRLPWFEEGLFVGRSLPDISEFPASVLRLCVEHYNAALDGRLRRAAELERAADALEESAGVSDQRADRYRAAGDDDAEQRQREAAEDARRAAARARAQGFRHRSAGPFHRSE
jgi:hypothetical protein